MSKRLQVLLNEDEFAEIQSVARLQQMTVAEWVRQTLRAGRRDAPSRSIHDKLNIIQKYAAHEFPTGSIESVLAEIEKGYRDSYEP